MIVKISYHDLLGNSKKRLNERGKKRLNAILECHVVESHTFSHEVSAFIYILVANSHVARDNYFNGGFIKFFFLQFKLI